MTIKGTLLLSNSIVKRSVKKKTKSRFGQNIDSFCDSIESLCDFTFFELQYMDICQRVWLVGASEKKKVDL